MLVLGLRGGLTWFHEFCVDAPSTRSLWMCGLLVHLFIISFDDLVVHGVVICICV